MKKSFFSVPLRTIGSLSCLISTASFASEVTAIKELDLQQYLGTWYEIASFPAIFQAGCSCTKAQYSANNDASVKVLNSCNVNFLGGTPISFTGSARIPDASQNSKLKVRFFGSFEADYWVLALAPDYSYAMVGTPDKRFLWVLSRERTLSNDVLAQLKETAQSQGFDLASLRSTKQTECKE